MARRVLELEERADTQHPTLVLTGELDMATAPELEAAVERLRAADGGPELTLDLRTLRFIDSTGLRAILSIRDRCAAGGCELYLIPGPPAVQRLFELTGLLENLRFAEPG